VRRAIDVYTRRIRAMDDKQLERENLELHRLA
jgi:hypothetical protein